MSLSIARRLKLQHEAKYSRRLQVIMAGTSLNDFLEDEQSQDLIDPMEFLAKDIEKQKDLNAQIETYNKPDLLPGKKHVVKDNENDALSFSFKAYAEVNGNAVAITGALLYFVKKKQFQLIAQVTDKDSIDKKLIALPRNANEFRKILLRESPVLFKFLKRGAFVKLQKEI